MLDILEGPQQGRKVFDQPNLVNASPTTVEIAQRTLSAICHATGKLQVNNSEELHLIPMTIQVGVKPPKDGYGERNTIRRSPSTGGFELLTTFGSHARIGALVSDFYAGPHVALRPRQCALGRSAHRHAGKRHRPDAVRRG